MRALPAILLALVLFGCAPKAEPELEAVTHTPNPQTRGVAPMASGAAGGMTPISGGESVDGAGMGGLGSAAKGMAQRAAASPSANSVPNDGE